jgi:hypothetical protein
MAGDFYTTIAQVLPLLLLALIWDSSFLDRLRGQRRLPRRDDPDEGVWFWTKARVRVYTLFVAIVVLASTAVTLCVLGGFIPDSFPLRVVLMCCVGLVLATLLTRIWYEVITATSTSAEPGQAVGGSGDAKAIGTPSASSPPASPPPSSAPR